MMPAPLMIDECATSNCTAIKAPEDKPETEVSLRSTLKAGSEAGLANACGANTMSVRSTSTDRMQPRQEEKSCRAKRCTHVDLRNRENSCLISL